MKRIYVDMDGVLADFHSAYNKGLSDNPRQPFPQSRFGFFSELEPIDGAIEAFKKLQETYDVWILTRPSISNLSCYSEKAYWLRKYFGEDILNKTVMSPNKSLLKGHFLIDDQTEFGQTEFEGELILFGSLDFPNWKSVLSYFEKPFGKRWLLNYSGSNTYENVLPFLAAINAEVIDHSNFPKILISASNKDIGNLQHFPVWTVTPAE